MQNKKVTKQTLEELIAEELNLKKKDAVKIVDLIFDKMSDCLAEDGTVDISGFGKFYIFERKERMGINPNTMEKMEIAASKLPKFRPSQTLKNKCNK
jgi:DNA-binding protein HU-beta